jgi:hypothetical protein
VSVGAARLRLISRTGTANTDAARTAAVESRVKIMADVGRWDVSLVIGAINSEER